MTKRREFIRQSVLGTAGIAIGGMAFSARSYRSIQGANDLLRVPFYMAAGETDITLFNSMKDLAIFNRYCIRNFWVLSDGGHEWANWRRYLYQTARIMFHDCEYNI
jgi:hypothetical protein